MKIFKIIGFTTGLLILSYSLNIPSDVKEAYNGLPELVDFNVHVKPILSDRCFSCQGPDENTRKAELRLDLEKEAFTKLASGEGAFVSKNPRSSASDHRILSEDPEVQMPPPESNLSLSPTDNFGYNSVQRPVHVHDFQATLMHLLGIDHERLTFKFQGRRYCLIDVHGEVVKQILS